jgi:tetrahydromethanopterin S-methyltransferase subunit G
MKPDEREEESRRALERVARETETVGGSAMARATQRVGDHFAGKDAIGQAEGGGTDPIELWGRRIGRSLSLLGVIGLTIWLGFQLGWWR